MAEQLALELARAGVIVISGLALGIDAAAHRGALNAGGVTVAVLGTGVDVIYPTAHTLLAEAIVTGGGALVSQFPDGTAPRRHNFPARNYTIAQLSDIDFCGCTSALRLVPSGPDSPLLLDAA